MLKVGITGTTRGLGQALHDHFVNKGCHVTAFNRESDMSEAVGCDLFINNAYGIQMDILNQLYASVGKMIVMGSIVTDFPDVEMPDYTQQKTKLEEQIALLNAAVMDALPGSAESTMSGSRQLPRAHPSSDRANAPSTALRIAG